MSQIVTKFIADHAVTNVKLAQAPANTLLGNNTGSTANVLDLTVAQVQTMLSIPTASSPLPINAGGTGQTTATTAFNALSPLTTAGDTLYFDGTNNARLPIGTSGQILTVVAGEPSWQTATVGANQQLSNLSGTVAVNLSLTPGTSATNGAGGINVGSATHVYNTVYADYIVSDSHPADGPNYYSVDVYNAHLIGFSSTPGSGPVTVDWHNALLNDTSSTLSIDWGNRTLNDSSGNNSINYDARNLLDASNATQLNWSPSGIEVQTALLLKDSTSNYFTQKANSATTAYTVSWPAAQGAASTVLSNDGAGNLSWAAPAPSGVNNKETFVLSSTDITNQYVTLAHTPLASSTSFLVQGGGDQLEGASYDYVISGAQAQFKNGLATGGVSALVAGDVVQIQYEY